MADIKQMCPYGTTCYRRNPVHFRETAHPHLDKLLEGCIEDMPIQLPYILDFACSNRSLLIQQLEIVRSFKRDRQEKPTNSSSNSPDAIIDLTITDDDDLESSSSEDEQKYHFSRGTQSKTKEYKNTQCGGEGHQHTHRTTERHETTQRTVEIYERTPLKVVNYANTQRTVANYENTQHIVENYAAMPHTVANYETTQRNNHNYENTQSSTSTDFEPELDDESLSQRDEILRVMKSRGEAPAFVARSGKFAKKLTLASPYYIFFTAVQKAELTWRQKLSITMPELLDKSLGRITKSLHIMYIVDVHWLLCQYKLAEQNTDMLIYFDRWAGDVEQSVPPNVKMQKIYCPNKWSVHHSKLSILQYEDGGIRIIVSTANLYREDWELRTQGLWISPHLRPLPNSVSYLPTYGESRTGFKRDFLEYLSRYNGEMNEWRSIVQKYNFSAVNVAFVASAPGEYPIKARKKDLGIGSSQVWGHRRLAQILENHVDIPPGEGQSMLIAQASSIGRLGPTYNSWIGSELVDSMSNTVSHDITPADFHFIFPSIKDYTKSYDMANKTTCTHYTTEVHLQQSWLEPYLHTWKASRSERTNAMPHIKTFTRISVDESKVWWFVLGSANLSKAAWGWRQGSTYRVNNYEAGVVFLPKFLTGAKSFPVRREPGISTPMFPIPYDLPLTHYTVTDRPYFTEFFESRHCEK